MNGAGNEALHVGAAAAIETTIRFRQRERRIVPVLPVDRHHVRVSRQHDASAIRRSNRGEQVGAARVPIGFGCNALAANANARQQGVDIVQQRSIRRFAEGLESDQLGEYVAWCG